MLKKTKKRKGKSSVDLALEELERDIGHFEDNENAKDYLKPEEDIKKEPTRGERKRKGNKEEKPDFILKLSLLIIALAILFFAGNLVYKYANREIAKEQLAESTHIIVPDLTGLDIDNAKEILETLGLNYSIKKSSNSFFDIDSVIKMSVDPYSQVEKGATISLYVSESDSNSSVDYSNIYFDDLPIRRNGIEIISMQIENKELVVLAKNTKDKVLDYMRFTTGYSDSNGNKILNKPSLHLFLNIEPFESFTFTQKIKNPNVRKISVEYIEPWFIEEKE